MALLPHTACSEAAVRIPPTAALSRLSTGYKFPQIIELLRHLDTRRMAAPSIRVTRRNNAPDSPGQIIPVELTRRRDISGVET
jgi:hypothetical protein